MDDFDGVSPAFDDLFGFVGEHFAGHAEIALGFFGESSGDLEIFELLQGDTRARELL